MGVGGWVGSEEVWFDRFRRSGWGLFGSITKGWSLLALSSGVQRVL